VILAKKGNLARHISAKPEFYGPTQAPSSLVATSWASQLLCNKNVTIFRRAARAVVIAVSDSPTDTISRARASSAFPDELLASGHRLLDEGRPETIVNLVFART
jgi:hypothetical protein